MTVEEELAPLHEGTTATIRATSLSGIANRYVSLEPGPNDARRRSMRAGRPAGRRDHAPRWTSTSSSTPSTRDTRAGLQQFIQGQATQYRGQARRGRASRCGTSARR